MGQAERASVVRLVATGHLQNFGQNQPEMWGGYYKRFILLMSLNTW